MEIQPASPQEPAPRALTALAAVAAPLANPPLPQPSATTGERLAREAFEVKHEDLVAAIKAGAELVPRKPDIPLDAQIVKAVKLALGTVAKPPSDVLGAALLTAKIAGVAIGIAAAQTDDPGLLKLSKNVSTGTSFAGGILRNDINAVTMTATGVIMDWAASQQPGPATLPELLVRRESDLARVVKGAAVGLAALPPGQPGLGAPGAGA